MEGLTLAQLHAALTVVAAWLGPRNGTGDETPCPTCGDRFDCEHVPHTIRRRPAPTGEDAANRALGPVLLPEWNWTGDPRPALILEGGPYEWAVDVSLDETVIATLARMGVFAEPYAAWSLCLYPTGAPYTDPAAVAAEYVAAAFPHLDPATLEG